MDERSETSLALVVGWAAGESHRVGEILLIPARADPGQTFAFGRGESHDHSYERLHLIRQRPGKSQRTTPLTNPWISRKQLLLRAGDGSGLSVQNVGSCKMLLNDVQMEIGVVRPGDILILRNQFAFFCTVRPTTFPPLRDYPPERIPAFGEADADGIVGESPAAWRIREQTAFLASRGGNVLLLGESGTGKELVARAIHNLSSRSRGPLVSRNAATLPPGLIDAELFGNIKDYPNSGMPARSGLFGAADGGTLFLDEIAELPVELQAHLLRVMDSRGEYQRLGDATARFADVRLVAATNQPLDALKHDLVARLSLQLTLPDLHERREDIPLIVRHLLRRFAEKDAQIGKRFFENWNSDRAEPRVTPELISELLRHRYTTHVRELEQLLWKAVASSATGHLALTSDVRTALERAEKNAKPFVKKSKPAPTREEIQGCLERNQGVQERVWRELGLKNRFALHRLMKKFGL